MKHTVRAQLAQSVNLTPQLLQSIRLLQLTAPQLEMELRQALDRNPMLEPDETDDIGETDIEAEQLDVALETAAYDELPEPAFQASSSAAGGSGDQDACARIVESGSSDPRVRLLGELAYHWSADDLRLAQWWLDHSDDRGFLEQPLDELTAYGVHQLDVAAPDLEAVRQRLLHGECPGVAAASAGECLLAQLLQRPANAQRDLAQRILSDHIDALARHDHAALATRLAVDAAQVESAVALILSLRPSGFDEHDDSSDGYIIPDVVVRHLGGAWRVSLNGRAAPRIRIAAHCEQALAGAPGDTSALRGLLEEARWLVRGIAMRNDTLLRTVQVLVERQRGFLERGPEAIVPLTLREVADAIEMHESTVSRITSGKYIQTPRGTFELKRLFAVRLEGAQVSGAAVKAMVKRLIDNEPTHAPLADDVIAGLLARQGVRIARRTVAKYRDQMSIAAARQRCKPAIAA